MKKLLVLFGIIAMAQTVSFAYINSDETSKVNTLRTQGYSESALRVIDTVNSMHQGSNPTYQKEYGKYHKNKLGKAYSRLKQYVDPIQDDGDFGVHQINYSNDWLNNDPKYASPLKEGEVEDL